MATDPDPQRRHWDPAYADNPGMYGGQPSAPAIDAATAFRNAGANDVLELGSGHGRDALFFAQQGFAVQALDFSATGLRQLREAAHALGVGERISTTVHDVRQGPPGPAPAWRRVFAHLSTCMAVTT